MYRKIFKDVTLNNIDKALKILEKHKCPDGIYDSVQDVRDFYEQWSEDKILKEE